MPSTEPIAIEDLLDRSDALPSPPAVALELLRLAEDPHADGLAMCRVLKRDPAIAAKLLRVVNAAAGDRLKGEVASLSQAVALAGWVPLKLIVLGFTVADEFASGAGPKRLSAYWRRALATAAAAAEVARIAWPSHPDAADESFAAGLLQGVGSLALLSVAPEEYGRVLDAHAAMPPGPERPTLAEAERRGLGFSHTRLSASMLEPWGLPRRLVAAIERQDAVEFCSEGNEADQPERIARSLWIANGLVSLLIDRELTALAAVTDDARRLAGFSASDITELVERIQPQIDSLAAALRVDATAAHEFRQTLLDAHAQMALVGEFAAARLIRSAAPSDAAVALLAETEALAAAVRDFLAPKPDRLPGALGAEPAVPTVVPQPHGPVAPTVDAAETLAAAREALLSRLPGVLTECRVTQRGVALALVRVELDSEATGPWSSRPAAKFRGWIERSQWNGDLANAIWVRVGLQGLAVVSPGLDRVDASRLWSRVATQAEEETPLGVSVGVASVARPGLRFEGERLVEAAERCLDAAVAVAGPSAKGIEVF